MPRWSPPRRASPGVRNDRSTDVAGHQEGINGPGLLKTVCAHDTLWCGELALAKWRRGQGIAMRAPTHRVKAHSTGMVTHNYGSAGGATYQMAAAEARLQEAVGQRERDWRAVRLGAMQGRLGRFAGFLRICRVWRDACRE